jgi:sugar-phosphatase
MPADRWAIVTSATGALARARFEVAGIPDPGVLVTADDVTRGKPDPEGYLAAARALGLAPADAVVVEDTGAGVQAARAAGVGAVIGVGWRPRDAAPDALVDDLRGLRWTDAGLVVA